MFLLHVEVEAQHLVYERWSVGAEVVPTRNERLDVAESAIADTWAG
jgi:hypothetical protein